MRLSAFFRPELLAFSLLGLMILSAANAQTRELGAFALGAGTLNPGTPDTGSNAAPPSPETNEKVESEPDAQPEPGPSAASPGPDNEKAAEPGTQPEIKSFHRPTGILNRPTGVRSYERQLGTNPKRFSDSDQHK